MAVCNIFRVIDSSIYPTHDSRQGRFSVEHVATSDTTMNTLDDYSDRGQYSWFDVPALLSSVDNEWIFLTKAT
jgi:hypothetical protein